MKTVVKCSFPDCDDYAVMKVAAPWKDGSHAELNTYGYACPAHAVPDGQDEFANRIRPSSGWSSLGSEPAGLVREFRWNKNYDWFVMFGQSENQE